VGCYFREEKLQKALAIVLSPGQATGQVSAALDFIQTSEESNTAIGKMSYCQDQVGIKDVQPKGLVPLMGKLNINR
jgi:hypothetical protein